MSLAVCRAGAPHNCSSLQKKTDAYLARVLQPITTHPLSEEAGMARCEVCGNDYEKAFQVVMAGKTHTFDSFECAIHQLAPVCEHCDCKIVGHGIEADGSFYCCAHCAREAGVTAVVDHA
jgi:hypothetical protein